MILDTSMSNSNKLMHLSLYQGLVSPSIMIPTKHGSNLVSVSA